MEPRLCYLFFWQGVIAGITITENVTISLLQAAADVFLRWELRWAIYSWIFEVSRYLLLTRICKITNFHFSFLKAIIVLWFNSWMKVKYHINKSNFFVLNFCTPWTWFFFCLVTIVIMHITLHVIINLQIVTSGFFLARFMKCKSDSRNLDSR